MYSVLKAPNNVSKSKMVRSVYSKCVGIREQLPNYNEIDFLSSLKRGFESTLGIKLKEGKVTKFELGMARNLVIEKYSNENWLKKYE